MHILIPLLLLLTSPLTSAYKYFHEPRGFVHFDIRYFKGPGVGPTVTEDGKKDTLRRIMRAYLRVCNTENVETWLAHGTLLGWWWNGKILPWDEDLDTQVSHGGILHLAKLNYTTWTIDSSDREAIPKILNTTHNHTPESLDQHLGGLQATEGQYTYLMDVNPHSSERVKGDGRNVIDARFIDTTTGLYVDITAIAETYPLWLPNVFSCKNNHRYAKGDIWPLRESEYEGMTAWVPYDYESVLVQEYRRKSVSLSRFHGHTFDYDKMEWIPDAQRSRTGSTLSPGQSQTNREADDKMKKALEMMKQNRLERQKQKEEQDRLKKEQQERLVKEKLRQEEEAKKATEKQKAEMEAAKQANGTTSTTTTAVEA
ncbi:hypothetical protein SAICODRAFT_30229 [Saitoella complicata NRRL Y-17804]|uniref:uncharacterized protein n=1 Tax=Saitoella complicata (strain BCRC 22490 / CBS 7301 / JCM 7358 / NBRC 10748 / NRRL Y-17804) TaxID=698492 RepID=UPI0008675EFB|nr:uncharacterized protein SAICODRAFT_30229 [Saitoella complicata NRRL Y-17804]ODQ53150.1 hypothetical protein SAICODRAFT_30229 [Saitoella complicata NRRL Y-17804]